MTSTKWLDKIEQLAAINGWDDQVKIYHMQNKLTGLARNWFNNLTTIHYTWGEWKELIERTFPAHHDYATTLNKLVARLKKPNETFTTYYFAKMDLLQACKITGQDAVSCIIAGLNDRTLQNSAKGGRYGTPEQLYAEYLSTLTDDLGNDNTTEGERKYRQEKKPTFDRKRLGMKEGTNTHRYTPYPKSASRCYNCRATGHLSKDCSKPRVECTKCKFLGHDAADCKRGTKKGSAEVKLVDPRTTESCYFVDCTVNGQPTRGYVDTGCGVVTVRRSCSYPKFQPLWSSEGTEVVRSGLLVRPK